MRNIVSAHLLPRFSTSGVESAHLPKRKLRAFALLMKKLGVGGWMRTILLLICLLLPCHAMGAEKALRILALTPHICEIFYAIHAESMLVGAVDYCDYPEAAKALPRVGSSGGIDVEAALRLKPDLAVVMSSHVKGVAMLEQMGVQVMESNPVDFETLFADMLRLGEVSQHAQVANDLVKKLEARLQHVRAAPRSDVAVFYELWADPLMTAGGKSFLNDVIRTAGGRNIFAEVALEAPRVNVEAVIRARPELIVVPLEGRNMQQRQQFWHAWLGDQLQLVAIDPDLLHRPGPRLIDGLEQLHAAIQAVKTSP